MEITETFIKSEIWKHWKKSSEIGTTWEEKTWLQDHEAVLDFKSKFVHSLKLLILQSTYGK